MVGWWRIPDLAARGAVPEYREIFGDHGRFRVFGCWFRVGNSDVPDNLPG